MRATGNRVVAGGLAVIAIALSSIALAAGSPTSRADVLARAFGGEAGAIELDDEALKSSGPGVFLRRKDNGRLGVMPVLDSTLGQFGGPSLRGLTAPGNAATPTNRGPLIPFGLPSMFAPPGLR